MKHVPTVVIACLGFFCLQSGAQDGKKSKAPAKESGDAKSAEVDVQFYNGSSVRMVIRSEKLDVATRFGKLQVPIKEIRSIEFGLHVPQETQTRIAQALKNLGTENFQQREDAGKLLFELGPHSYAAVQAAARDGDPEVARRASEIAKKLQGAHAKSDLKTSQEDRIVTDGFTVVGEILTPSVKAKAQYFGEVELSLSDMRSLRVVLGPTQEMVVVVDALTYANAGQWLDTKFRSDGRSTLAITAKGAVDQWPQGPGQYMVGPNGLQQGGRIVVRGNGQRFNPNFGLQISGMLVGKIGENGEAFAIGDSFEGLMETEGNLFLHIGPSPWNCQSSGNYEVKITRKN